MSAIRKYDASGRPYWDLVDDGAVGRMSAVGSIRGSFVVGDSERDRANRVAREWKAEQDATVKAARDHDYYQRNKAKIMEKQRQRRQSYKRTAA